jgi:hypothetical protein
MKKVIKSFSLLATCFCLSEIVYAQGDIDAIRYSSQSITGTARSLSMAGAFGALGADFTTLSTNPAGIALYKRSEFTITPALENRITSSDYLGMNAIDNKLRFNLGNLGIVWAFPKEKKNSAWKGFAFGMGYNRLNSFHSRSFYQGVNTQNSLLDSYVEEAMGNDPNQLYNNYPYSSGLAYEAYAIDVYGNDTMNYFSVIPDSTIGKTPTYGELQRRTKETYGLNGEIVLSFGGNYNDKVYWGVTLGFPYVRYHEDVFYEERDHNNSIEFDSANGNGAYAQAYNFSSFGLVQSLYTYGNGFNAKFGLIFKPIDVLRLGVAIHTPAWYNMHDEYATTMMTSFENGNNYSYDSPLGTYNYDLTTPFRAIGSAAFIFRQTGLISVDYEYVDYTTAKLHAHDYSFADENYIIKNSYAQQHNLRAGVEYKAGILSVRGGYGFSTGVFKKGVSSTDTDQHKNTYSGGLGIREEKYFVDFGYSYSKSNEFYRPYTLENQVVQGVTSEITDHRFLLTVGFRF